MNKQIKKLTYEHLLYILAFLLALGFRFVNLGEAPLSEFEAGWANQSWDAVQGEGFGIGPNPGFVSLTSSLFYLFGSSNAAARFWPAIVGSLLVLAPFGFRMFFGQGAALIMAFGLAIDPGLVAVSRLAGGPMLALGFGALTLALFVMKKPLGAAIFGGLALSSGASIFSGLTVIIISYGAAALTGLNPIKDNVFFQKSLHVFKEDIKTYLLFLLLTIILVSTLFFRFPAGLGAFGDSITDFFRGWFLPSMVPAFQPMLAVVFYQPLALVFACIMAVRGWLSGIKVSRWLSLWVLFAILFTLLYPGRNVFDATWALVPIWALAAMEIGRYLKKPQPVNAAYGQAGIVFVLGVLFWLVSLNPPSGNLSWVILVIIPLLAALTTILIGMGWSWDSARSGFLWGIIMVLGVYILAASFKASQINPNDPRELWTPPPGPGQISWLEKTLQELSTFQSGREDSIQIVTLVESQSLQWMLKSFSEVTQISALDPGVLPAVIIAPDDGSDLSQTMAYRGQDFLWSISPNWIGALPPGQHLWEWVTTRQAPVLEENLVLWVRSDLFPEQPSDDEGSSELNPSEDGSLLKSGPIE